MPRPDGFRDELTWRQIRTQGYAASLAETVKGQVADLTETLCARMLAHESVDTKELYRELRSFVRKRCAERRDRTERLLRAELRGFVGEQAEWLYANCPAELERADAERMARDVFFGAFRDGCTVGDWPAALFGRIFRLWNAALASAYRTGVPMKTVVRRMAGGRP